MSVCYVDTSALAKRYVLEEGSDHVDEFLVAQTSLLITSLTRAELRSLLARRRRSGDFDVAVESQLFAAYLDDVGQGYLREGDLTPTMIGGAVHLMDQLPDIPLRTLDAIHLAAARQLAAERLVTADACMRDAATELEFPCEFFGAG